MNTKVCTKCKVEKALSEFYKCKCFKDGLQYKCKICTKAYYRDRQAAGLITTEHLRFREKAIVSTKVCIKCKIEKSSSEFYERSIAKDGLETRCKECMREEDKAYYQLNRVAKLAKKKAYREQNRDECNARERARRFSNRDSVLVVKRAYYARNRAKIRAQAKVFYEKNRDKILCKLREFRKHNKAVRNKKRRDRRLRDTEYRLRSTLRSRSYDIIKNAFKDKSTTYMSDALLGCTYEYLKNYISAKFYSHPETGACMSWDNYGEWQIDHIKPLAWFRSEEAELACHYSNLQPMWAEENMHKGARVAYRVETPWLKYDRDGNLVE